MRYTCDGCGKWWLHVTDADDVALGYHGNVMHHYETGGISATWYACSQRCIETAVVTALEREQ